MSASSAASHDGIMGSRIKSLVNHPKPTIEIALDEDVKVYTNGDQIRGVVSVTATVDTPFTQLDIEFLGTSRSYVERLTSAAAVSGRSEAFHQFLKLEQPNAHNYYPEDCLLKAGKTYEFPFIFVIPQQLLPKICRHKVANAEVHNTHVCLPPTLGDKDLNNNPDGSDDLAPEMASIRYGVFARLSVSKLINDEVKGTILAAKARRVRVLPTVHENPPLAVENSQEYVMRKEKKIKKGVLQGKLGTLVIEAAQPKSLRLPSPHNKQEGRTSTMARLMLRFDPADEKCPPPRLGGLATKLKVNTFFASTARQNIPCKQAAIVDLTQGIHTEHINLSSRCMANVEWKRKEADAVDVNARRDSGVSTSALDLGDVPTASEAYRGKSYYVAKILVPIVLPTNKTFVPSFHSCLISRSYCIGMSLSLHTAGLGGNMDLKIPVQVSSEGDSNTSGAARQSSVGSSNRASMESDTDEEIDEFFRPRLTTAQPFMNDHPEADAFGGREAPPMYSVLPSHYRSPALVC